MVSAVRAATDATRARSLGCTRLMKTSCSWLNSRSRFGFEELPPPVAQPTWRGARHEHTCLV
eukprot:5934695-Prymnesium_polylepis.1